MHEFPGATARLVATFQITAADLAAWDESPTAFGGSHAGPGMSPARSMSPSAAIFACYFDGPITLRAHPPEGGSNPTVARALVIIDGSGSTLELRGGTEVSLPLVRPAAPSPTPWPTVAAFAPTATLATWRTTPISSTEIAALLTAAGLQTRISPPAPARALLYNSTDLDLLSIDDPAIRGAVIHRYPSVAAANAAFHLDALQNPAHGTVTFIARPHFIGLGDTIVSIATDDEALAARVIAALTRH